MVVHSPFKELADQQNQSQSMEENSVKSGSLASKKRQLNEITKCPHVKKRQDDDETESEAQVHDSPLRDFVSTGETDLKQMIVYTPPVDGIAKLAA